MFWVLFRPSEAEEVELGHLEAIKKGFRTRSFYILFLTVLFVPTGMNWVGMFYKVCIALIKMWIKNFEEWLPVIVLWNVRFLKQMMWTNGILRISRFYDIPHETVVTPATDFGILRKCSILVFGYFIFSFIYIIGFKLTTHDRS